MTAAPFEIGNRTAAVGWGFMAVFLGMTALFTWIMGRDGPHPSQPGWLQHGVIGLFWIVGVVVAAQVTSIPCTRLRILADGSAVLIRRWPLRRQEERFRRAEIAGVEMRRGRDSDGDPYFTTVLLLRDGREELVREGHDEAGQQMLATRLRAALGPG